MGLVAQDFYSGENLETFFPTMEDNLFDQNEDISAQIDEVVGEMRELKARM